MRLALRRLEAPRSEGDHSGRTPCAGWYAAINDHDLRAPPLAGLRATAVDSTKAIPGFLCLFLCPQSSSPVGQDGWKRRLASEPEPLPSVPKNIIGGGERRSSKPRFRDPAILTSVSVGRDWS